MNKKTAKLKGQDTYGLFLGHFYSKNPVTSWLVETIIMDFP